MKLEVTEQGLLIPKDVLAGIDVVEIRKEQRTLVVEALPAEAAQDSDAGRPHTSRRLRIAKRTTSLRHVPADGEQQADAAKIEAELAEFDRLGAAIGAMWPKGVSAVDAVRDVRREL